MYVSQLDGFEVKGEEEKVQKLKKSLYGLKQALQAWYSKIDSYLIANRFERSKNEPILYVKKHQYNFLIVCLYVDDMIYGGSSYSLICEFRSCMVNKFEMIDLGLLH